MSNARPLCADLDAALREALAPTELTVRDDSHEHAGHAGAREGGHYFVRIRSARFTGLGRVARHRLIYDALKAWMPGGIHSFICIPTAHGTARSARSRKPAS